ncbi:MAG: Uma2 family endonuclease [Acidobacteria bacterium]|nr:Uma2 family endonuclease [Acidobacteriota bacterium]
MASNPKKLYTPEEYLAMEREAEYKSEYFDGEIFAMAGASEEHNLIAGNIFASLHSQVRKHGCRAYTSDMRIDMSKKGLYAYPDVVVVCGESKFSDKHKDNLINPKVIIEVLSKSTEAKDRGFKFMRYRKLDSFVEYLLVSQDKVNVEHYVRQSDNRWIMTEISSLEDTIKLSSIQCELKMSDIYEMN